MKAQSDTQPEKFVKSNGKTQVNYNIQQVERTDEKGTRLGYEYDYVEIDGLINHSKVIQALNNNEEILDINSINPDTIVSQFIQNKINTNELKQKYINIKENLIKIQQMTNPTNEQVIAAVKSEATILEQILNYIDSRN